MAEEPATNGRNAGNDRFPELRALIVGPELEDIRLLQERLDDPNIRAEEVGHILADAVRMQIRGGPALRHALQPIIEQSIRISVLRDPHVLADALFPIIGAAIRKAVATEVQSILRTINGVVEQRFSIRSLAWRWEALTTGRSFGEVVMLRSLLYRVEQVFLIHRATGLLLAHRAAETAVVKDADMVSGMLTAIQDYVRDSFGANQADKLETMQVGELTVLIRYGPAAILAGALHGYPPQGLESVFQSVLETISKEYVEQLSDFNGDATPFESCQPLLAKCFMGQAQPAKRRFSPLLWLVPSAIVVALAVWGIFSVREAWRWNDFIQQLREQPGIELAQVEKRGRHYFVAGFRDPLREQLHEVDPLTLLSKTGISPERVQFHWDNYQSDQAPFAPLREFVRAKERVERTALHFESDSAQLSREQIDELVGSVADIRTLLSLAAKAGKTVVLQIVGYTDDSGSESRNARLAEARALEVKKMLVAAGIPADKLSTQGRPFDKNAPAGVDADNLVTTDLAQASEEAQRTRSLDRAVTFRVLSQ
jgi:outer membrane protein OmpA-like peptidoglycan-associated protein